MSPTVWQTMNTAAWRRNLCLAIDPNSLGTSLRRLTTVFRSIVMVCRLSEPVPGLMAWLTVRHHHASTGKYWRTGVFLRDPIAAYSSEALMELRTPGQLVVDVRAPSPDLFFNVLRDSIENLIIHRWPGLNYELAIPCTTRSVDGQQCRGQFPLNGLLRYREQGGVSAHCWDCDCDQNLSTLLTGFDHRGLIPRPALEQLQEQLTDVVRGVRRLEGYAADTADNIRRILGAVTSEVTDCPRLFTVRREKPTGMQRLRPDQLRHTVTLWCEHPGHWHPWPQAEYSLSQPREWLIRMAPYAILLFRALQLVAPIAEPVAGLLLTGEQLRHIQDELKLMAIVVEDLPSRQLEDQGEVSASDTAIPLSPAEGQALRGFRIWLFEHDHMRGFGGLRRVQSISGEFLWICPQHYVQYDPGLPRIPGNDPDRHKRRLRLWR